MSNEKAGARVSKSSGFSTYNDFWAVGTGTVQLTGLEPATTYFAKGLYDTGTSIEIQADYTTFETMADYMFLENRGNSQVTVTVRSNLTQSMHFLDLQYSYDGTNWTDMPFSNASATVTVPAGGKVYFRGDNEYWYSYDYEDGYRFSASGPVYGGGNIMTLLDRSGKLGVVPENGLMEVFSSMTNLVSPPDCSRILEIDKNGMDTAFGWSGITTPPDFSNLRKVGEYGLRRVCMQCDSLTASCDFSSVDEWWEASASYAFALCDRLAYVPPFANAIFKSENMQAHAGNGIFEDMFSGCTSLTEMPDLTAISISPLQNGWSRLLFCSMFAGCTSLRAADKLPRISASLAGTLATGLFLGMFKGCTSLAYADLSGLQYADADSVCREMFYGCTSLSAVTQIPATVYASKAFQNAFQDCTSLASADLAPTAVDDGACEGMFQGCTSLRQLASKALPATTLGSHCYRYMFAGCTSLTTAPELPAEKLPTYAYQSMFNGCTSLTSSPELPAWQFETDSMRDMFAGCSRLSEVTVSYGTTSFDPNGDGSYAHFQWLWNVAARGTLYVPSQMMGTVPASSVSGCPSGWTLSAYTPN